MKNIRTIIYSVLFSVLCVIDLYHSSRDGGSVMFITNSLGVIVGILILCKIGIKSFMRKVYLLWFPIAGLITFFLFKFKGWVSPYAGRNVAACVEILVFSLIIFYMSVNVKSILAGKKIKWLLVLIWCVLMCLCIFSRNEYLWPIWYLLCFFCFYIFNWDKADIKLLFSSMLNGMIIGFFLVQGSAFVFRPYDCLRYRGMYANSNMNALFYLSTMCAFLGKMYELKKNNKPKWLRIVCFLFVGTMISFTIFTEGKTAILAEAVIVFVFFILIDLGEKKHIRNFFLRGFAIVCIAVVALPVVYVPVRYLPAYFHHPVWFWDEYYYKPVHSDDPIDSDKFVSFDEAIESSFGRLLWFVDFTEEIIGRLPSPVIKVYAYDQENPMLSGDDASNPLKIRTGIWKYYLSQLDMKGHKIEEAGVWLTPTVDAPHAHNAFIQIAFEHGIPAGILFIFFVGTVLVAGIRMIRKDDLSFVGVTVVLFTISFIIFGFFEVNWRPESLPFAVLFISGVIAMRRFDDKDSDEVNSEETPELSIKEK